MKHSPLLLSLALVACTADPPPATPDPAPAVVSAPASAAAASQAPALISVKGKGAPRAHLPRGALGPEGPLTYRSTSAEIYLGNLKARGEVLVERQAKFPDEPALRANLAGWHQEAALFDGDLDHALKGLELLDGAVALKPSDPKLLRQRAGLRSHLHRFAEAKADLEAALRLQPGDVDTQRALGGVLRNLGDWQAAEPLLALPLVREKNFQDYGDEAIRAFQAGKIEEADHLLRLSAGSYKDVHPVPLAWVDLQRGLLRLRTGRYPEARVFFKAAYDRIPQHFTVAEHLAEVESLLGNHTESLRIYDEVVAATHLPEFMAKRAGELEALGRKAEAEAALTEADARWRVLLARHETALAAHAISFWLDELPNPAQALMLADKNLLVRRDPDSVVRAARAHAAAGDVAGTRALVAEARRFPVRIDEFFAGIADALNLIGDQAGAQAALAEARVLNPLTADLDPPPARPAQPVSGLAVPAPPSAGQPPSAAQE